MGLKVIGDWEERARTEGRRSGIFFGRGTQEEEPLEGEIDKGWTREFVAGDIVAA